jgi:hypothetical protein
MKVTIGADPEFFLRDISTGEYVSAHDKVPGNKKHPEKLPDGSFVQADGTAVEFNIPPVETPKQFKENILSALNEIRKIIPSKYAFVYTPIIQYSVKEFNRIPDSAKELGCDPDFCGQFNNIYQNKVPDTIGRYRTGSGHIHLGWTKDADTKVDSPHFKDCVTLVNDLEIVYSSSKHIFDSTHYFREAYYGAPYAFRPKPYGVEYRSPSNAWLNSNSTIEWVARVGLETFQMTVEGKSVKCIELNYLY